MYFRTIPSEKIDIKIATKEIPEGKYRIDPRIRNTISGIDIKAQLSDLKRPEQAICRSYRRSAHPEAGFLFLLFRATFFSLLKGVKMIGTDSISKSDPHYVIGVADHFCPAQAS